MSKKTKIFLGVVGLLFLLGIVASHGSSNSTNKSTTQSQPTQSTLSPVKESTISIVKITVAPILKPTSTPIPTVYIAPTTYIAPTEPPAAQSSSGLSNNNYYQNIDGNEVHSPADSTNGSVPAGATAQCNDGTYSFSQHHSGTCSGHDGVSQWL